MPTTMIPRTEEETAREFATKLIASRMPLQCGASDEPGRIERWQDKQAASLRALARDAAATYARRQGMSAEEYVTDERVAWFAWAIADEIWRASYLQAVVDGDVCRMLSGPEGPGVSLPRAETEPA